jgi:hypothetical protein
MNWDQIILRAIVPISFAAIWILTALFNRESKGFPPRPAPPASTLGPRPAEPTMRWATPPSTQPPGVRRVPIGDDDILIIQNDPSRPARLAPARPPQAVGSRRSTKARTPAPPAKKVEPSTATTKLAGVSQNVNQNLARPIELTPLTSIKPMATSTDLAHAPSAPSKTSSVVTISTLIPLMHDPLRLREAFIVNDLLQPPLALRGGRGRRR